MIVTEFFEISDALQARITDKSSIPEIESVLSIHAELVRCFRELPSLTPPKSPN
jgi:hypothetical protein